MKRIAVFLDRDGTINKEGGYINHEDRYELLPKVTQAIKKLNDNKILVIVATNQAGVARGYFTESLVKKVHNKLKRLLRDKNAKVDAIYYCPHHPKVGDKGYMRKCICRKPKTGMIDSAVKKYNIDKSRSYIVGDKISDVKWGHRAGLKSIMVMTGYGKGEYKYQRHTWDDTPDFMADNLYKAVDVILKDLDVK